MELSILFMTKQKKENHPLKTQLKNLCKKKETQILLEDTDHYQQFINKIDKKIYDLIILDTHIEEQIMIDSIKYTLSKKMMVPFLFLTEQNNYERDLGNLLNLFITEVFFIYGYLNKKTIHQENLEWTIKHLLHKKEMQLEKERILQQAMQKNDELQSIIYTISHNLRTPLTAISGLSREMKDRPLCRESEDIIKKSLEHIYESAKSMTRTLNSLTSLAKYGSCALKHEILNMNTVLIEVLNVFSLIIKKRDIHIDISEELPDCYSDEILTKELFMNLISNAIKYIPPRKKGFIKITGETSKNIAIYTIADNGIGIKEEDQQNIFNLYQRVNTISGIEGEGLGLTIVHSIIGRLNGSIELESEPNVGTKFYIRLPLKTVRR